MQSDAVVPNPVDAVIGALGSVLPTQRPIAPHEPEITAADRERVDACLASGWISSVGPEITEFEEALSAYTGIPHVLATINGTAALHLALLMAGVSQNDEVLTPALTFIGTVNPIRYQDAWPHFVDCEENTLGIDPVRLEQHLDRIAERRSDGCYNRETGRRIRALIVVHILGIPARMPELKALAQHWKLHLIEDAAEALGSSLEGRHVGHWSDFAILSFNGNKIISSGGGGALLCSDEALAQRARHLGTTAKLAHPWAFEHDQVGYNYRMPNLNAALGLSQLQRIEQYLAEKALLHERYNDALSGLDGVHFHTPPAGHRSNHWLNLLLMPDHSTRDALLNRAQAEGIQARPFWRPAHQLPMYRDCPRDELPTTDMLHRQGVCLPGTPGLAR